MKSISNLFLAVLFLLCSSITAIAEITPCETAKGEGLAGYVIEPSGAPTPALLGLAKELGLKHLGTFPSIADELKRVWYRSPGQERWQISEHSSTNRKALLSSFEKLGMLCEKRPDKPHYAHALLLGGLLPRVRMRLAFLAREWERGIHFDSLALLGSARPLDPKEESHRSLSNSKDPVLPARVSWKFSGHYPRTEFEMMKFIFNQASIPDDMRQIKVIFVNTPNQRKFILRKKVRAETVDTVKSWLAKKPKPGSVLAVSNQPFIGYQHEAIRKALPKEFSLETVGAGLADSDVNVDVLLDDIARWTNGIKEREGHRYF